METPLLPNKPKPKAKANKPKPNKYQILLKRLTYIKTSSKKKDTLIEMNTYSSPLNNKYYLISI